MIFVGDIAYPNKDIVTEEKLFPKVFEGQTIVGNLEGALTPKDYSVNKVVFNELLIIRKMSYAGDVIFSLANNHITDIENGIENTLEFCKKIPFRLLEQAVTSWKPHSPCCSRLTECPASFVIRLMLYMQVCQTK